MKKKLLFALLFLSIFISGCSYDFFSGSNGQNDQKVTTDTGNEEKDTQTKNPANKPDSSPEEGSGLSNGRGSPVDSPNPGQVEEPSEPDAGNRSPIPSPDGKQPGVEQKPGNPAPKPETETPAPVPEPKTENPASESKSILDDPFMVGIIVALVVMILILAWLIYDRHKMKNTLNNLNNRPTKPDTSPQNVNTPHQNASSSPENSAPIVTANLNQSLVREQLKFKVGNLQHVGSRKEQQDSFCISDIGNEKFLTEKGLMAVVADGMGGLEGGALISNLVTDTFIKNYNDQFNFEPVSFLYHTAQSAELTVENYMKQTGINGGSTLVAVMIKDYQMNYVSVGDSHIYLLRNNVLTLINKEHSFGALLREKAERGEIDPREPDINPKRNSLTAYIGMGSFEIVDRNSQPIVLRGGDKVLLCSDGVYNALGDDALISALAGDATTAARKVQADILAQNIPSQDNFTAVIIECIGI